MKGDCMICAFADPLVVDGRIDFARKVCKANPPVPVPVPTANGIAISPMFPVVKAGVWCGRFEPRHGEATGKAS